MLGETALFLKPTAIVHIIQLRALFRCHAAPPSGHNNTVLIHLEQTVALQGISSVTFSCRNSVYH